MTEGVKERKCVSMVHKNLTSRYMTEDIQLLTLIIGSALSQILCPVCSSSNILMSVLLTTPSQSLLSTNLPFELCLLPQAPCT